MACVHYNSYSNEFLVANGADLYNVDNGNVKFVLNCGTPVKEAKNDSEEKDAQKKNEDPAYIINVASNKTHIAVISNNKVLELIDRQKKCVDATTTLVKRPTAVLLTNDHVVVSDKPGDVYMFDLKLENRRYLLGHVSVVLDIGFTVDERFLVSCDRDEKIRVSHYPNGYNIHSYLLGHTEYVYKVVCTGPDRLVSVGGDSKLIYWDMSVQKPLQTITGDNSTSEYTDLTYSAPYIVTSDKSHICVYKITEHDLTFVCKTTINNNHSSENNSEKENNIISVSASKNNILVLSSKPELCSFKFVDGKISDKTIVSDIDLTSLVISELPNKKKPTEGGLDDYFDKKRRRMQKDNEVVVMS